MKPTILTISSIFINGLLRPGQLMEFTDSAQVGWIAILLSIDRIEYMCGQEYTDFTLTVTNLMLKEDYDNAQR